MNRKISEIGNASQWKCFATNETLNYLAIGSTDGIVSIYTDVSLHTETYSLVYGKYVQDIKALHFIKDQAFLIGFGNNSFLYKWFLTNTFKSFEFEDIELRKNENIDITCICECQNLKDEYETSHFYPLLVGYSDGEIEMIFFSRLWNDRSNRISIQNPQTNNATPIDQILEMKYENGYLLLIILKDKRISKYQCSIKLEKNTEYNRYTSISLEIIQVMDIIPNLIDIVHITLFNKNSIIICTNTGMYGVLNISEDSTYKFNESSLIFPYGPFPCKKIKKCIYSKIIGIKNICHVFYGGMPAITYKDLNTLSVSVNNEPTVCFTFDDMVLDFVLISDSNEISSCNEILVLTKQELVSVSYHNGSWNSSVKNQFSPFSKCTIIEISNIVKISKHLVNDESQHSFPQLTDSFTDAFSLSLNDNTVSVWYFMNEQLKLLDSVDLGIFYGIFIEDIGKSVQWPPFQKCGKWGNRLNKYVRVESMKLIEDSHKSLFLLISTFKKSIFLFKISFSTKNEDNNRRSHKPWSHHYFSINNTSNNYPCEINNSAKNSSHSFYLLSLITFSEHFKHIMDFSVTGNLISFTSDIGVGWIDIYNGKHFFVSSDFLKKVEQSKSELTLSKLNLQTTRPTDSFDINSSVSGTDRALKESGNKISCVVPKSMLLWQINESKFDLILGFEGGPIVVLYVLVNENGDFYFQNHFRKISNKTNKITLFTRILKMKPNDTVKFSSLTLSKVPILVDDDFENLKLDLSFDDYSSLQQQSISPTISENKSVKSLSRKSSLLKWLKSDKKEMKEKTFLFTIDAESVKAIEYIKMKTKYKFKIKDNFRYQIKKDFPDKMKICICDLRISNNCEPGKEWICSLLLSNAVIIMLQMPTLQCLKQIDFSANLLDFKLLSLNWNLIIHVVNKNNVAQLKIFGGQKYMLPSSNGTEENNPRFQNTESNNAGEKNQIDFMMEAQKSLDSLF